LGVTLRPDDFAVLIGATVTIVVDVSGGDEAASASITCTASNGNITVESAVGSCRVTGVTGGSAILTVRVERGSRTGIAHGEVDVIQET
jgi:uncharacterized protein YjdB